MKKSKFVTIGLLALSIAGCHKKKSKYPPVGDWSAEQSGYVSTDGGYGYQRVNNGFPIWVYYYMMFRPGYGYGSYPGAAYYYRDSRRSTIGTGGSFGVSEGGHTFRAGSVRGGFGSLGRSVSA